MSRLFFTQLSRLLHSTLYLLRRGSIPKRGPLVNSGMLRWMCEVRPRLPRGRIFQWIILR